MFFRRKSCGNYKIALLLLLLNTIPNSVYAACIGVATSGGGNSFWDAVKQGALKAGEEIGMDIYFRGPIDEADTKSQELIIDSMIERGCIGLVVAPNTIERANQINELKTRGIPTVYIDRDMPGERAAIIKTQNFLAGKKAGEELSKALKGKGNVALLRMKEGVVSTTEREMGFLKGAQNGGLTVAIDDYLGTTVGIARDKAYSLLRDHPDIQGIFTPNESTSLATVGARKQLAQPDNIVHIGFDAHHYILNAIRDGVMYGSVVQHPYQMGYQGVHTVHKVLKNENYSEIVNTEAIFVNKENIDKAEVAEVLTNY